MNDIARMILADRSYADRPWSAIALVIEVGARRRMYGFVYTADGWEAETPGDWDVLDRATDLADATSVDGKRFARVLVQISRPGPGLDVAFDYDDSGAWVVTPGNHREMAERLRPRSG